MKQLDLFISNTETEDTQVVTKLHCRKCDQHKPLSCFNDTVVAYETGKRIKGSYGIAGTARYCRECIQEYHFKRREAKKQVGQKPTEPYPCDCCGTVVESGKLMLDHDHNTGIFRGWLCRSCNLGMGQLGDTIEGLEQAIRYLEKHNERS